MAKRGPIDPDDDDTDPDVQEMTDAWLTVEDPE
jgi:hypothetical protein